MRDREPTTTRVLVALAVLLVMVMAVVAVAAPSVWAAPTEATLNLRNPNPSSAMRADIEKAIHAATLVRVQESYPKGDGAVRRVLAHHPNWRRTSGRSELGILWDRRVWQRVGEVRVRRVLAGSKHGPWPRWIQWVPLRYRATGQVVTVLNVHADPGGCWQPSPRFAAAASTYFHAVANWSQQQRRLHPKRAILLGGDLNCWVPRVLRRLYRGEAPGRGGWGADHLLTSNWGNVATVRRWHRPARSDHDLELRRLRFRQN